MTQFEFLTVFISIVLAFGVSNILSNWGAQIRLRKHIRRYGLHFAWSVLLLILIVQAWWALWALRDRTGWNFIEYLVLLVPYLTLALIAYVLTPSLQNGERDIKRYYYDNSPWFFALAAVYVASQTLFAYVIRGVDPISDPRNVVRFSAELLFVVLAVWRNERLHMAATAVGFLLLMSWVAISLFSLQE